jgi:hypothetical protein
MANTKISALTSGNPAQSSDLLPIDRGGSNFSITAGSIAGLAGGLNIATSETPSIPSPLYSPSETPADTEPYIFSQDINGSWHTQAVIDTTTANGGTGQGPADPAGTLTWTRRQYFRDNLYSLQGGKNAFLSVNHNAQAGTLGTNQDRAVWVSMGNPSSTLLSFSITDNVVTFGLGSLIAASYTWLPGQNVVATGLGVGTYLNGVSLNVLTAVEQENNDWIVTASNSSFTHADVASTADTGNLDLIQYSMECLQMELDIQGSPQITGEPDGEYRTLSLQCADTSSLINAPDSGIGCLRASYTREGFSTSQANIVNALFNISDESSADQAGAYYYNIVLQAQNGNGAGRGSYVALEIDPPLAGDNYSRQNIGINIPSWPTQTRGVPGGGCYAFYIGAGESYFNGSHLITTADMAGQATVVSSTTSIAVAFATEYIGTAAPVVVLTPTSNPEANYWVTIQGSANAWTGFTINIASAPSGNVVFNYSVSGQF